MGQIFTPVRSGWETAYEMLDRQDSLKMLVTPVQVEVGGQIHQHQRQPLRRHRRGEQQAFPGSIVIMFLIDIMRHGKSNATFIYYSDKGSMIADTNRRILISLIG